MDISASQYSGASESGWTHYLDQSSLSQSYFPRRGGINVEYEEGKGARRMEESEEEEDLSMVSDASSGPPHYDNNECYCENWYPYISSTTKESQKKKKKVKEYGKSQQQPSPLDDTASSPVFSCHKVNVIDIIICVCVYVWLYFLKN